MPVDYYRTEEEVVFGDNLLFPFQGLNPDLEAQRNTAIIEVLRRIPESDFQHLDRLVDTFTWYMPAYETLAGVMPFYITHPGEQVQEGKLSLAPYARVIYLAPRMEDVEMEVAVAAVAHELAHIFHGHKVDMLQDGEYQRQEDEAWNKVEEWGFIKEVEAHRRYYGQVEI